MCIDVYQADTTPNGPSEDALIYSLLFFRQEAFCDAAWYPCLDAVRFLVESFWAHVQECPWVSSSAI